MYNVFMYTCMYVCMCLCVCVYGGKRRNYLNCVLTNVSHFFLFLAWPRYKRKDILHIKLVILSRKNGNRVCGCDERIIDEIRWLTLRSPLSVRRSTTCLVKWLHTLVAETSPIFSIHAVS